MLVTACPLDRYAAHNCIGHNYIDHVYIGHNYIGHNYVGHASRSRPVRSVCTARTGEEEVADAAVAKVEALIRLARLAQHFLYRLYLGIAARHVYCAGMGVPRRSI